MKQKANRLWALVLSMLMLISTVPAGALTATAATCNGDSHNFTGKVAEPAYLHTEKSYHSPAIYYISCVECGLSSEGTAYEATFKQGTAGDDYYSVVNSQTWDIAPGITEHEMVLNNSGGERRQVVHVMEVDISNPYVSVLPSYMGMNPKLGKYKVAPMSQQAAWVEKNMGLNVVGAMNTALSWYDSDYYMENPKLKGEPVGTLIINGKNYTKNDHADTCLIINYDEKDGVTRPDSIPKVEMRTATAALTGWEEQAIPCNFGFVVKNGKNVDKSPDHANQASKSVLGIKADGTIVLMQNDGRQSPYSNGMSIYEIGEAMIALGCVYAVRCDGGGSSAYLSQRPGEELKVNSSPSDGIERTTTSGILVISTAPSDGEFARASITAENTYYAPGSKVTFEVVGTDLAGTKVDIPEDVAWQIAEEGMGTVENGVFTSNGTTGMVTVQMVHEDSVVGQCAIEIVVPETFCFQQNLITVPFGKAVSLALVATVNNGLNTVTLDPENIQITTTNAALGTFKGTTFTAVAEDKAPADLTSTITATIKGISTLKAQAQLNLGRGSEIIEDFEDGIDGWQIKNAETACDYTFRAVDGKTGCVHDGNSAAGIFFENNNQKVSAKSDAQLYLKPDESILIDSAMSVGAWVYVPDDFYNLALRMTVYAEDADGKYTVPVTNDVIAGGDVYTTVEESGWHYFSVDVSEYDSVMIRSNKRFIEMISQNCSENEMLQTVGSPHGQSVICIDDITVDYSTAADDREKPIFKSVTIAADGAEKNLVKGEMVTVSGSSVTVQAAVVENELKSNATGLDPKSAKAFVDGQSVKTSYANGIMQITDIPLAAGAHRIRFEISDNAGNTASVIRVINVKSGVTASTIEVVPADPSLDRLYGGSLYWMDVNATMIETVNQVTMDIDLNAVNHWELDHMEVAEGFTATYTVAEKTNTATITITRTGDNTQTGKQTLASLPIRVIYYDTDIANENYTAETFWKNYNFWPQDVAVDVDRGVITYTDSYTGNILNTFSSIEYRIDTEFYTSGQHMDPAFKAERGTAHVHKAEAVEDKTGSCTEDGYTGRTYCDICDSIVDWGTIKKATSHSYKKQSGVYSCKYCGEKLNGTLDGKTYFDGVMADGWIEDTYYYEDGKLITGSYIIDGKMHTFDENGVHQPDYVFNGFYETPDGKLMYFVNNEYLTDYQYLVGANYFFDKNGYGLEGEHNMAGETCLFENGQFVSSSTAELIDAGMAGETATYVLYKDGTLKLGGFGATYSATNYGSRPIALLINDIKKIEVGAGITRIGTNFLALTAATSVEFAENSLLREVASGAFYSTRFLREITLPDNVEYIGGSSFQECTRLTKVVMPASVNSMQKNSLPSKSKVVMHVVDGSYAMDHAVKYGYKYVIYTPEAGPDKEIVDIEGALYYFENGKPYYAGLFKLDGDYYYADSTGKLATGSTKIKKTNGLMEAGTYEFDKKTGKMLNPALKNGIYTEDGVLYYYKDGEKNYAGLIQIGEDYYYVGSKGKVATGSCYVEKTNGLLPEGDYEFDDKTGKMLIPSAEEEGVTRVFGADRYATSFKSADTLKEELGVEKFSNIIVASGTGFADALAGSYLAAVKNAPILLVRGANVNDVKDYIKANLTSGGTVYLLGGVNAVPQAMESGLDGFNVKRLGGADRYETNLLILNEAGVGDKDVIVCTGLNFADSLSASASGLPILLVKGGLTDAQKAFLSSSSGKKIIVGGTAAVSASVEGQLKAYGEVKRLAGDTRYDTSVLVAKEFFSAPKFAVLAYAQNFPDGLSGGPLAYALKAPLILTDSKKPTAAVTYATSLGIKSGYVLGGSGLISDQVVCNCFKLTAEDQILTK